MHSSSPNNWRFVVRWTACSSMLFAWMFSCSIAVAHPDDSIKESSLKLAPVDADIYVGSFRLKEQLERIHSGPVVQQLLTVPAIKDAIEQFKKDWKEREGVAAQARFYLENPNILNALTFAQDLASNEVFYFADKNLSDLYILSSKLSQEVNSRLQKAADDPIEPSELIEEIVGKLMKEGKFPTIVVGAKFSDEDAALSKLDELEGLIRLGVGSIPIGAPVVRTLERVEDSRGTRLQWKLSGSQIPWDVIPPNDGLDEEALDTIKGLIVDKSFTITIGQLDSYFIFAISPDGDTVNKLGSQKTLLDNPLLAPATKDASLQLTSVAYVSDALSNAQFENSLNNFFSKNFSANLAPVFAQVEDKGDAKEFLDKIVDDMKWLDDSIGKYVPKFQGTTSIAFLTKDGWERHDHIRTKDVLLDGSAKLDSLNHVGGDPLLFVSSRMQNKPEYFQLSRKIVQRLKSRLDDATTLDLSELNITGDNQEEMKHGLEIVWPVLVRIADTWEKKFLPSFNGEHAIVVTGGKLAAKQWFKEMPPSEEPLPLLEVAGVTGLKDKNLYKGAWEDLFSISDDVVALVKKLHPESIPADYTVPRPKVDTSNSKAEKYSYPIPDDCPVPKEMAPQGVFAGDYFIASLSDSQSVLLGQSKPLAVGKGVIDASKPLKNASYVHVGKLIGFFKPWVKYGLLNQLDDLDDPIEFGDNDDSLPFEVTGRDVLDVWDALTKIGDFSSVATTTEDGGSVVRSVYKTRK